MTHVGSWTKSRHRTIVVLPEGFYNRATSKVARDLLGKVLRVRDGRKWHSGVILETEAYVRNDPANHAFHGPNKRNQSMFKGPGTAYVYRIHQVYCVNAVTRTGEAVLLRTVELLGQPGIRSDGPGRLCQALNITKDEHDGKSLTDREIQIIDTKNKPYRILVSRRIGVTKGKEKLLRFLATPTLLNSHQASNSLGSPSAN